MTKNRIQLVLNLQRVNYAFAHVLFCAFLRPPAAC